MAHSDMYQACKVAAFPPSPQELPRLQGKSLCCDRNAARSRVAVSEPLGCVRQPR